MKVLCTGGNGFLGRGIMRQVALGKLDWEITSYARDETKADECKRRYPFVRYVLGDVRDTDLLAAAMTGHDAVVHGGAVKYLPDAERNVLETVSVNVGGSLSVIKAARRAGVERVVGISTDKAAAPSSVYGATKMLMERMFSEVSTEQTIFTTCRYGNVVGSTGSVIPLFKRQYAELGKVRVTDPQMTRFWMSVDEAISLIVYALTQTSPGATAIPYAKAMTILDVARAATVDDVEVEVIGIRPGEKLHETLLDFSEGVRVARHSDWMELLPYGSAIEGAEAFTLASHSPNSWMTLDEMRAAIEDSALV